MKVFISQPMRGRTQKEIKKERAEAIEFAKKRLGVDRVNVIDSFFADIEYPDDVKQLTTWAIGKSIQMLGEADVAVFCENWENYRGCRVERKVCEEYGIKMLCVGGRDDE